MSQQQLQEDPFPNKRLLLTPKLSQQSERMKVSAESKKSKSSQQSCSDLPLESMKKINTSKKIQKQISDPKYIQVDLTSAPTMDKQSLKILKMVRYMNKQTLKRSVSLNQRQKRDLQETLFVERHRRFNKQDEINRYRYKPKKSKTPQANQQIKKIDKKFGRKPKTYFSQQKQIDPYEINYSPKKDERLVNNMGFSNSVILEESEYKQDDPTSKLASMLQRIKEQTEIEMQQSFNPELKQSIILLNGSSSESKYSKKANK